MIYFIIYLFFSFAVSLISLSKRVSFVEIIFISLFLTPVMGLIIVLRTENNILTHHYTTTNICSSCGDNNQENESVCTHCGVEMSYTEENKLKLA